MMRTCDGLKKKCFLFLLAMSLLACTPASVPDRTFTDLNGQVHRLSEWRGHMVLINFWATSCTTCVSEMPKMVELYKKFQPKGLKFVAVAMSYDPPNYVIHFAQSRQLPFPVTLDIEGKWAKTFGDVKLTPTTFLLDQEGRIIKKYVGLVDMDQLVGLL